MSGAQSCAPVHEHVCVLQLGLDRIELPETAKQPVSRKRTKSEADSPASSAQNAPSPVGGPSGPQVGLCPISGRYLVNEVLPH